jgi:anti-anti-sigma factor
MNISIRDRDGYVILRPQGNILRENGAALRAEVNAVVDGHFRGLALDFGEVEHIDSSGLGCCVGIHKLLYERKRGPLVMFNPSPEIEQLWTMIKLDLIIPVLPDEEAALAKLSEERVPFL